MGSCGASLTPLSNTCAARDANLDVVVIINGNQRPLFNANEISHMHDVQGVFTGVRRLRLAAGAILLLLPLVGLTLGGSGFMPRLGTLLTIGGIVTVVVLGLAGLLSFMDFSEAFVKFHEIFFSGGNWMFDPRTDYLVMLFPEGFWFDATLRIAMLSAIEAVVIGGVGVALVFFGRRSMTEFRPPRGLLVDLDGVVYHGDRVIPDAPPFFRFLRTRGIPFLLTTNNSTLGPGQYVEKLAAMDIVVANAEVLGSADATASYIAQQAPAGDTRVRHRRGRADVVA